MKKFSFFALATVGLLLGACSSDNEVTPGGNGFGFVEGQNSFIAIGLATPGTPISRANDDFDDGIEAEWKVYNGTLILFKGTTEVDAILVKSYDITSELVGKIDAEGGDAVPSGKTVGEISHTSKKIVKEIDNPKLVAGQNLYAYVILNKNDVSLPAAGTKFTDFSKQMFENIGELTADKGLLMTNTPIADKQGGSVAPDAATKVTTLAKVDDKNIYATQAAAEAGTYMACIYVERAAVKVELETASTLVDPVTGGTFSGTITWGLGNVNTKYFNTRQYDSKWNGFFNEQCATASVKYRFIGGTPFFTAGHEMGYRTYWGKDVNYDGTGEALSKAVLNPATDYVYNTTDKNVAYTYENTFDENNQIFANTTYVGMKIQLNGGAAFYTLSSAPNTRFTSEADAKTQLAKNIDLAIGGTTIKGWKDALTAKITAAASTTGNPLYGTTTTITLNHNVTLGSRDAAGQCAYTHKLAATILVDGAAPTPAQKSEIESWAEYTNATNSELSTLVPDKVNVYNGGVAYYAVRISHYGDVETPWAAHATSKGDYAKIYPTDGQAVGGITPSNYGAGRAEAWLGRWGIVRNNWYKLTISGITGFGTPEPIDYSVTGSGKPGSTPDDDPDPTYFISAHIHILPWALRTQAWDI